MLVGCVGVRPRLKEARVRTAGDSCEPVSTTGAGTLRRLSPEMSG